MVSGEQWPAEIRRQVDEFAARLRAECHVLPVVYFNEHIDAWSMGDFFRDCFPEGSNTRVVFGDQFEVACYSLPDDNRLADALKDALKLENVRKQPREEQCFRVRLQEAMRASGNNFLSEEALLVVLRQVLDVTRSDIEVRQSLLSVPGWLAGGADLS